MERLTIRNSDGMLSLSADATVEAALYRLAQYEDTGLTPERARELAQADKDGRLVELPCRIDAPVYLIHEERQRSKPCVCCVEKWDIDHFTIGGAMIPMITACSRENEWKELVDGSKLGQEYFLTREEAQAALKEARADEINPV